MKNFQEIAVLLMLTFLVACGPKGSGSPSSSSLKGTVPTGYHDVWAGAQRPIYVVISFPDANTIQFTKYYLHQDFSPGTYSVDLATTNTGFADWAMTFHDSDCAPTGSSQTFHVYTKDQNILEYALSTDLAHHLTFDSTDFDYWKLDQYHLENYVRGTHCE